jgi:transposase
MVGRGELTESAWLSIEPLLPRSGRRGGQWQDHRRAINGVLWKLRTGAPWRDLPELYGPWQTCADRLYRWRREGLWDRLLRHVQTKSDALGEVVWEVSIDSSIAHPPDEGVGRSRGGLTTKFHLACDGRGRPLSIVIMPGQRHDSTQLQAVLDGIRIPCATGRGRPRTRPNRLIADKGYSYPRCRRLLWQRQIKHAIPERHDQRTQRAVRPGRPVIFDQAIYARRNAVERCIDRLKQWRGVATRYEKRAVNYRAMLILALPRRHCPLARTLKACRMCPAPRDGQPDRA